VYHKQALIDLVRDKALKFGEFTLASGKKARYYLDGKQVTLDSFGARLVAEGILELLGENLPAAVGGMSIGADPISAAVITVAGMRNLALRGFMVRKEAKGHGTGRYLEGPVLPGEEPAVTERRARKRKREEVDELKADEAPVGEAEVSEHLLLGQEVDEATLRSQKLIEQVSQLVKADPSTAVTVLQRWIDAEKQ
jgi:hypothetical protein